MKKLLVLYSLITLSFFLSSCQKDDDNPIAPPITAENTFSCKINGELFVPENHGGFIDQYGYRMSILNNNSWKIILSNDKVSLFLFIKDINSTGEYKLHSSNGDQHYVAEDDSGFEFVNRETNEEYVSTENSGKITVSSFETGKKLIFSFDKITLHSISGNEENLILTNGKLNLNKETLNKEDE